MDTLVWSRLAKGMLTGCIRKGRQTDAVEHRNLPAVPPSVANRVPRATASQRRSMAIRPQLRVADQPEARQVTTSVDV